jgi:hypothetical protein
MTVVMSGSAVTAVSAHTPSSAASIPHMRVSWLVVSSSVGGWR